MIVENGKLFFFLSLSLTLFTNLTCLIIWYKQHLLYVSCILMVMNCMNTNENILPRGFWGLWKLFLFGIYDYLDLIMFDYLKLEYSISERYLYRIKRKCEKRIVRYYNIIQRLLRICKWKSLKQKVYMYQLWKIYCVNL